MTTPHSDELDVEDRDMLVRAAILAPSMHNTQPWRFRFRGRTAEVHRDPRYELPAEDPQRRMVLIGVGAVVFNLRVAAAWMGFSSTVTMQDRTDQTLAAEVTLDPVLAGGGREISTLYPYLPQRRTNREPFTDREVPAAVKSELAIAAGDEGAMLEWVTDPVRRDWLLELAANATWYDTTDDGRAAERRQWIGGERDRDGVPSASLGPRPNRSMAPVRDLAANRADRARPSSRFEPHPQLAVLITRSDSPPAWLIAGQALQHVLLVATRSGVSTSLLNQAIEHKDLRWLIRDPLTGRSEPQVVLRLGYGPEVSPTPRRPVAEFIDQE